MHIRAHEVGRRAVMHPSVVDGGTCLPTGILEVASIGRSLKLVGVDAGFVVSRHVLLDDQ